MKQIKFYIPVTVTKMPSRRAFFYIRSRLNGLVLDIKGGDKKEGTRVIMWKSGDFQENQLWWEDIYTRSIRSKLNDLCLDLDGSSE